MGQSLTDHKCFGSQNIVLNQKNFWTKKFFWPKIFSDQNFFRPTLFWPLFSDPNFFSDLHFLKSFQAEHLFWSILNHVEFFAPFFIFLCLDALHPLTSYFTICSKSKCPYFVIYWFLWRGAWDIKSKLWKERGANWRTCSHLQTYGEGANVPGVTV